MKGGVVTCSSAHQLAAAWPSALACGCAALLTEETKQKEASEETKTNEKADEVDEIKEAEEAEEAREADEAEEAFRDERRENAPMPLA